MDHAGVVCLALLAGFEPASTGLEDPRPSVGPQEHRRRARESDPRPPGCSRRTSPEKRVELERVTGIEPAATCLASTCLTLRRHPRGASSGSRTHENLVGSQTPCRSATLAWSRSRESNPPRASLPRKCLPSRARPAVSRWRHGESNSDLCDANAAYARCTMSPQARKESNPLPQFWRLRCSLSSDLWRLWPDSNQQSSV